MNYRILTENEITQLRNQGCRSGDWSRIRVANDFVTDHILNTIFEGEIRLGVLTGDIETEKGIIREQGIFNCSILNCKIAGKARLSDIKILANYHIGKNVVIENVDSLVVNENSTFGNGIEIEILNEGGGREVPVFDRLSSQIAYLVALYRHDTDFIGKMLGMIRDYAESQRSGQGRVESGARIQNSQVIRNVLIGAYTTISGACLLEEGTISGRQEAPVFVGEGVVARKFVVLSGSRIDGSAILEKCFIGQGVRMGKQFSAENSLFFANCEAFHGEACSLFAGPYTVSHHKSSLLIAGLFSFFNAGSGTNQSNHMYKLGPVHQGIWERGSKTGSFAYVMLPCFVGPYSVIMGKHYNNFDSSDFPFSYINEEKGKSELTPAMNLFTVGTRRDSEKWPARDRRNDPEKLDLIHFGLFNPYTVGKIINAIHILEDLAAKTPKTQDYVNYKGLTLRRLLINTTRKFYEMALEIYIGQETAGRMEGIQPISSIGEVRETLAVHIHGGTGKWIEIGGMFSPAVKIDELINSVKNHAISTIDDLYKALRNIFENFGAYSHEWYADLLSQTIGAEISRITTENLIRILAGWKITAVKFNNMILKDAEKEFDLASRIGYGIDGDAGIRDRDFEAVRGTYESNKFVSGLKNEITQIEERADRLITILRQLPSTE